MSMMDPNLLDAQAFGGPQSPLDIKPEASLIIILIYNIIIIIIGESSDHRGAGRDAAVPGLSLHLPHGLPRGRLLSLLPIPALPSSGQCKGKI